ncbi:MAG: hypothetical protein HFI66_00820 [Lachnospiraceae bacterium]|nr:hypothetical protein [Lachnospiraceae bacterium]
MEEKKKEERNEANETEVYGTGIRESGGYETDSHEPVTGGTADGGPAAEMAGEPEAEEKEERRGLFGAKKRERNEKAITVIYAVAGVYLLYTAYMTVKELIEGKVEPGRDTVINIVFTVIFAVAAVWILISSWRLHNMLKAKEKEEAEKLAAEMAERGETPEEPVKGGLLGGLLVKPELNTSSVASRAAVYYNPADEEEDGENEEEEAGPEADGEEKEEQKAGKETEAEAPEGEADDRGGRGE